MQTACVLDKGRDIPVRGIETTGAVNTYPNNICLGQSLSFSCLCVRL